MRQRTRTRIATGSFLACLVGVGAAWAQDEGEESDLEVVREADLAPAEQIAEGERIQTSGANLSRQVMSMLDEARREADIIRVTCLNDKLTQINANLSTVEQRVEALREAIDGNDNSRRDHEFTVLSVLAQKFVVLNREASQCVGQDPFETGATRVTTTIDPETPEGEGNPPEPPPPPVTPPTTPPESPGA